MLFTPRIARVNCQNDIICKHADKYIHWRKPSWYVQILCTLSPVIWFLPASDIGQETNIFQSWICYSHFCFYLYYIFQTVMNVEAHHVGTEDIAWTDSINTCVSVREYTQVSTVTGVSILYSLPLGARSYFETRRIKSSFITNQSICITKQGTPWEKVKSILYYKAREGRLTECQCGAMGIQLCIYVSI